MTNVPGPTFGPNGFIPAAESAILAGMQADWNAAFQTEFDFGTSDGSTTNPTPQGQITTSETAVVGDAQAQFCALANQFDPAYATGRYQDAIARIYFLKRIPSQPTILSGICSGLDGVVIPADAKIIDTSGNIYTATQSGTIAGGTVVVPFAALIPGPTPIPGATQVSIYQTVNGWDSVTIDVDASVLGNDTESRPQFEVRRREAVAKNSVGTLPAVQGAVLDVSGVIDAYVTENDSSSPVTIGGVTVAAKSLYVAASGGTDAAVARAAWSKKAPGCAWNGNTAVTVTDDNPGYSPPFPSYTVTIERPSALAFLFAVSIINSAQVPSDAVTQIQNAIVSAFGGGDGGPRARIGATVLATRFYAPVALLGSWAQILSLQIGSANTAGASFTGAIAGTALTTSGVTGTIAIGQTVQDVGGVIAPGTTIVSGSGSSWVVSISQTVTSRAMTGSVAASNSVVVKINQQPELAAANVQVTLV